MLVDYDQKLKIVEPINSCTTVAVSQKEPVSISIEEVYNDNNNSMLVPKRKNVLGRIVKTVGNIVWNNDKGNKKKVKCSSL